MTSEYARLPQRTSRYAAHPSRSKDLLPRREPRGVFRRTTGRFRIRGDRFRDPGHEAMTETQARVAQRAAVRPERGVGDVLRVVLAGGIADGSSLWAAQT